MVCEILVPQPGIKPTPTAVEVWSLNHWTAEEVPLFTYFSSSRFLCINVFVIAINHYRFFSEASKEYI